MLCGLRPCSHFGNFLKIQVLARAEISSTYEFDDLTHLAYIYTIFDQS